MAELSCDRTIEQSSGSDLAEENFRSQILRSLYVLDRNMSFLLQGNKGL
jgi:hypothetical protein